MRNARESAFSGRPSASRSLPAASPSSSLACGRLDRATSPAQTVRTGGRPGIGPPLTVEEAVATQTPRGGWETVLFASPLFPPQAARGRVRTRPRTNADRALRGLPSPPAPPPPPLPPRATFRRPTRLGPRTASSGDHSSAVCGRPNAKKKQPRRVATRTVRPGVFTAPHRRRSACAARAWLPGCAHRWCSDSSPTTASTRPVRLETVHPVTESL